VSGLLLGLDGTGGLRGWQWLFLLEGLPSLILGLVVYRYLQDKPQQASWLTENEKTTLQKMVVAEHTNDPIKQDVRKTNGVALEILSPTVLKYALA